MKALSLPFLHPFAPYGMLLLRLGLGLIMASHGWQKIQNPAGTAGFFGSQGIPAAQLMVWVVIVVELIGGILLILGLGTRVWALLSACVMLTVIFVVKGIGSFTGEGNYELELAILSGMLALALVGPGRISVDAKMGLEE